MSSIIYIVVPCYNEEAVLHETSSRLAEKMHSLMQAGKISPQSRVMFVNDGSKDRTWEIIEDLVAGDNLFQGVKLSRNKGHQNALLAGLMTAKDHCDAAISMDADLQDDINAVDEMIAKFDQGCDIVYGVRSERKTDTFFKKFTAQGYYKLLALMGVDIVYNHADYRLMSRRALQDLESFGEVNLFLRGVVPMIGYRTDKVYYERAERRRVQVPPQENAGFCHGGHHLSVRKAHPLYYHRGLCDLPCEPGHADLQRGAPFYGSHHSGLDLPGGVRLGHRRTAAAGHRRCG